MEVSKLLIKAKAKATGKWYITYPMIAKFPEHPTKMYIKVSAGGLTIDQTTICRATGKNTAKGQALFENDIVFDEIEKDHGDLRVYFVVVWIEEKAGFAFLSYGEWMCYTDNGWDGLIRDHGNDAFDLEGSENLHYAGNLIDDRDKWESDSWNPDMEDLQADVIKALK